MLKPFGKAPDRNRIRQSPHFRNGKFQNPVSTSTAGFSQVPNIFKHFILRNVEQRPVGNYHFNEFKPVDFKEQPLLINWLGHASVLIKLGGQNMLTDPMLGNRASPFKWLGPKRFFPTPIPIEDLPALDLVLISHDHYDHLDYDTIVAIHKQTKCFVVPVGVMETLLFWGVPRHKIIELEWWQEKNIDGINVTAAPARHFSGRLFHSNNTHWNSYVIRSDKHNIYFAGDSGFFDQYKELADRFAPFDFSFLPVGAYFEEWLDIHMDPEEAVKVWKIIRGGAFIPIHWGTFDLGLHAWYEPVQRLVKLSAHEPFPLLIPKPGEWFNPLNYEADLHWWTKFSEEF